MKLIADSNVLVRFLVQDDEKQFRAVCDLFGKSEEIIIPTHVFCELVWVLSAAYKLKSADILEKMDGILKSGKVVVREDEVEAGLRMMQKGGDFADGVIAYGGRLMASGASVFASFDRQAVRLLAEQGITAIVPE